MTLFPAMDEENFLKWSTCPVELLLIIFKSLDCDSLVSCLFVCKSWRNIVEYMCQSFGLWKHIAEEYMVNKGITYKQKSTLSWKNMLYSSLIWDNMTKANVKLDIQFSLKDIRNIHVYKDNLIVVCESFVKYYNANTLELIKEIYRTYLDYQENDHFILELTDGNNLTVNLKNVEGQDSIQTFVCHIFKLEDDRCYILDETRSVLWLIKNVGSKLEKCALTRSYGSRGSICDININYDNCYVLSNNACVFKVAGKVTQNLKKIYSLKTQNFNKSPILLLFGRFSIVYRGDNEESSGLMKVQQNYDSEEVIMECPGLTCAVSHGEILLLGYEDGTVGICKPPNMIGRDTPDLQFSIKELGDKSQEDATIVALDVHETYLSHHIFVVTKHTVFKVLLTYPNK